MGRFSFEDWLGEALIAAGIRPRGATREKLAMLGLPQTRASRGRAPLPPSMLGALRVHAALAPFGKRLIPAPKKSVSVSAELATMFGSDLVTWTDAPDAAGLVPLPSSGDQRLFLWVGDPSPDGEYPIVALTDEPDLYVRYASFAHYLATAFGALGLRPFDTAFGSVADAKRRAKRALARERIAEVADVEAPLQPAPSKAAFGASAERSLAALAALDGFAIEDVYSKKYRASASAALGLLVETAPECRAELSTCLSTGPFQSASAAAAALVQLARVASEPGLVVDVLAALDQRPDEFDQEWLLDQKILALAVGDRAHAVFEQAFERSASAPKGPYFTLRYAGWLLSQEQRARGVSRAILAARDPIWGLFVHGVKISAAARKRVLQAFLPRGFEGAAPQQFRVDDPLQHLEELKYALEANERSPTTVVRLERRATELVSSFAERVGGDDVFGKVVASAVFREASRVYPGATTPLRDAVKAAQPLTSAARSLAAKADASVVEAKLDRFRDQPLTQQQLFLLSVAAFEALKKKNLALARAIAELVLVKEPAHGYAQRALDRVALLTRTAGGRTV